MKQFRKYRQFIVLVLVSTSLLVTNVGAFAAASISQYQLDNVEPLLFANGEEATRDAEGSSVFGFVWTDFNQNGMHDDPEPLATGETVFITPDAESDFAQILVLATDQQGQFHAGNLPSGRYRVWTEAGSADDALVITVTEDRAVMTIQLPLAAFSLYIPHVAG